MPTAVTLRAVSAAPLVLAGKSRLALHRAEVGEMEGWFERGLLRRFDCQASEAA